MYKITSGIVFILLLSACSNYEAQNTGDQAIIPANTFLSITPVNLDSLIPNQESSIKLSVPSLGGNEVSGVYITANVFADSQSGRATINAHSMIIKSDTDMKKLTIKGHVVGDDGLVGIPLGCGMDNLNDCGLFEYRYSEGWEFSLIDNLDISNVTIMVKRSYL
ncbi:MAG: hypothetical protein AB2761_18875 [Candidatus Thiodiazotropha endolucinida]